jgi:hypothetical protein
MAIVDQKIRPLSRKNQKTRQLKLPTYDWSWLDILLPFLLVEIPWGFMIQFTILVGPIPMSLGKCHHVCCILFACLLFLSILWIWPIVQGNSVGHFLQTNHPILFFGDNLPVPQKKIVLRKGRRCLRWAQNEMSANRRITMNIIQPNDNLRSWSELTIDPPHRNWKNLA